VSPGTSGAAVSRVNRAFVAVRFCAVFVRRGLVGSAQPSIHRQSNRYLAPLFSNPIKPLTIVHCACEGPHSTQEADLSSLSLKHLKS
jgi:hypothetical protein